MMVEHSCCLLRCTYFKVLYAKTSRQASAEFAMDPAHQPTILQSSSLICKILNEVNVNCHFARPKTPA